MDTLSARFNERTSAAPVLILNIVFIVSNIVSFW